MSEGLARATFLLLPQARSLVEKPKDSAILLRVLVQNAAHQAITF